MIVVIEVADLINLIGTKSHLQMCHIKVEVMVTSIKLPRRAFVIRHQAIIVAERKYNEIIYTPEN